MKRIKFASALLLLSAMSCTKEIRQTPGVEPPSTMAASIKSVNPVSLRAALTTNDIARVVGELKPFYNKVVAYELAKGNDISGEDLNTVITYGILKMEFEKSQSAVSREESFSCFMEAVGGLIGLAGARTAYNAFVAGSATKTIIAVVRVAAGRVATVFTTAWTIYELGECMGAW